MKALIQRVSEASVAVAGDTVGAIGPGLLVFVAAVDGDDDATADKLANRVARLRIFRDSEGRMNRALRDTGGSALVVSQFTLAADTSRGNRPGLKAAAPPETGRRLYERFAETLQATGIETATGHFGADMAVALVNDGPVTIWLES